MSKQFEELSQPVQIFKHPSGRNFWSLMADSTAGQRDVEPFYSQEYVTALRAESAKWFKAFEKAVSVGARYEERIAELEQRLQQPALADVIAERQRQISAEGWTPEHDDQHASSEMAGAAACYAKHVNARGWVYSHNPDEYQSETESSNWPWDASWWKPTNPRRDLVKAGALILAEIERLDRAAAKAEGE